MGGDGTEDGRGVRWEEMVRRVAGEWGGRRWYGGWQVSGLGGDGTEDGRGVGWEEWQGGWEGSGVGGDGTEDCRGVGWEDWECVGLGCGL